MMWSVTIYDTKNKENVKVFIPRFDVVYIEDKVIFKKDNITLILP